MLDFSVEGKESDAEFDSAMNTTLKIMDFADEKEAMPIAVFKPSGFGRLKLFEKVGKGDVLSLKEQEEWQKVVNRYDAVCKKGKEHDIEVLIDAEETWMQSASDALVTKMMQK